MTVLALAGRLRAWRVLSLMLASLLLLPLAAQAVTVTDLLGRQVTVPDRVNRILLGEGRLIYTLALLEGKNPFARVAGWQGDFRGLDVQGYQAFRSHFPQADDVPLVGGGSPETFSAEKALSLRPDVAILVVGGGHGPNPDSEAVRQMEAAGVPIVYVDFSNQPLRNTVPSMRLLGQVLGRQAEAEAFVGFYTEQVARVTKRIAAAQAAGTLKRPRIFVDMLAGLRDCCGSPGRGNLGDLIEAAGGANIGAGIIPGPLGMLNAEYILAQDPDVYVATGVFAANQGGVTLGYSATPAQARDSLRAVAARTPTGQLRAVREGRVHGMWHVFYDSPEHLVALHALARWLHPDLFRDLDPAQTRAELYKRFMPFAPTGVLVTGIDP